jgi:hypothetical protein
LKAAGRAFPAPGGLGWGCVDWPARLAAGSAGLVT